MKAFLMSIVLLLVVTAGAAFTLQSLSMSSSDTFTAPSSVRL